MSFDDPMIFTSLLFGAMLPYAFSALTMKSVGHAASKMCEQVKIQHAKGDRDPTECIKISTEASLTEMILPGILVIFTPLVFGGLFGPKAVSGYLAGVIVSGVQMAISSSNSGGAWDNAKKYIEAKKLSTDKEEYNKVKRSNISELLVSNIQTSIPTQSENDYKRGWVTRYFTQKTNDKGSTIYEVNSSEYLVIILSM